MVQSDPVITQIKQLISGGQTGVDRAALDVALVCGIPHGGWCPRGRIAADGVLDVKYQLQETASAGYSQRTKQNVLSSSGTLIIYRTPMQGGSVLTKKFAQQLSKPCFEWALDHPFTGQYSLFEAWLQQHRIEILNVAGPSEARCPGIYQASHTLLCTLWHGALQ